jgi:isoquinoline 1-oxidoreductase beta subunit
MSATRREFLRATSLSGTALLLDVSWAGRVALATEERAFKPNAWLRIDGDGAVTITVGKSEMGQGVRTALPMLVAEELDVDLAGVSLVQAVPGPSFRRLRTGGSSSVYGSWAALRKAGAAAREMLVSAAAARWEVEASECRSERGGVVHNPTGRRIEPPPVWWTPWMRRECLEESTWRSERDGSSLGNTKPRWCVWSGTAARRSARCPTIWI